MSPERPGGPAKGPPLSAQDGNLSCLAREIARAESVDALAAAFRRVQGAALRRVVAGLDVLETGRLVSEMHDQFLIRACQLVTAAMGSPAPARFSLLVLGSEGRKEQCLATDQDNALVYDDEDACTGIDPARSFFARFGRQFIEVLTRMGIPVCAHEVMISNPDWRMGLSAWLDAVDAMARAADEAGVLRISMLLDMRGIVGDAELSETFRSYLFRRVANSPIILKYMAREALRFRPPLGLFRRFLVGAGGSSRGCLDIKKGGVFPVTQGVRTMAVTHGVKESSTLERITRLHGLGAFSARRAAAIREAFELFQSLRIRGQAEQIRHGLPPGNCIAPAALCTADRARLRACFQTVADFQSMLFSRYDLHLLT